MLERVLAPSGPGDDTKRDETAEQAGCSDALQAGSCVESLSNTLRRGRALCDDSIDVGLMIQDVGGGVSSRT